MPFTDPTRAGFEAYVGCVRRRDAASRRARRREPRVRARSAADRAGVTASGEVLDGRPPPRLVEFADLRGARLLVVGPRRPWRFRRSISRKVQRDADRPVLVADAMPSCRVGDCDRLGLAY